MQPLLSRSLLLLAAWAGTLLSGCAADGLIFKKKPEIPTATAANPAARIYCM